MKRKITAIILVIIMTFSFTGCWSYRGLNELSLVMGIGIDMDDSGEFYETTFEIIDLTESSKDKGIKSKIVESSGKTLFDAVRNAKKRLQNRLYFAHAQVIIIGEEVAKRENVLSIIDLFMRDGEPRETIHLAVSKEKTAKDILTSKGVDNKIVSLAVRQIIDEDAKTTSSTSNNVSYKAFNILKDDGKSLMLAALHLAENDKEKVPESDGVAIFDKGKLSGFLSPEQTKYVLFVNNEVKEGSLSFDIDGKGTDDVSFEINKNNTKKSFSYENGKLKFKIETNTDVFLDELKSNLSMLDKNEIKSLEQKTSELMAERIKNIVLLAQASGSDVFGLGDYIYKHDFKVWRQLEGKWYGLFPTVEVEVKSVIHIRNSSFIKEM
ncbi:MAG: Ger(x)C family spore germination protein [Bacillota bacterium]|nr:Ger(x)C family spore germination protein [Bacillota bacterium]